jgi:hypothetical protein
VNNYLVLEGIKLNVTEPTYFKTEENSDQQPYKSTEFYYGESYAREAQ